MSNIIHPGAGILYMKVGIHAKEPLEEIIARKTKEIEDAGYALWGYGGNTCHPQTMVQPFAKTFEEKGEAIYLCMQEISSKHRAERIRAEQCSTDGIEWTDIPAAINAVGSRYALVIKGLRQEEMDLSLDDTQVAIGLSQGRMGSRYIKGQVDKACLEVIAHQALRNEEAEMKVKINLVAELRSPYAVYLRAST